VLKDRDDPARSAAIGLMRLSRCCVRTGRSYQSFCSSIVSTPALPPLFESKGSPSFFELPETSFSASISHFRETLAGKPAKSAVHVGRDEKAMATWQSDCQMFPITFDPEAWRPNCHLAVASNILAGSTVPPGAMQEGWSEGATLRLYPPASRYSLSLNMKQLWPRKKAYASLAATCSRAINACSRCAAPSALPFLPIPKIYRSARCGSLCPAACKRRRTPQPSQPASGRMGDARSSRGQGLWSDPSVDR